jgi:hypothetical protein
MLKILGEVNEIIGNYQTQNLELVSGLPFNMYEMIRTVEFYSSSRYLRGQLDELGREKPFYNVGNGICDVENAAVDLDTKDLQVTADEPVDFDKSFLMTKELQNWMKEDNFGKTLNEIRDTRTRYGGVIAKMCMETKKGKKYLTIQVPEWKNLIVDPVDIENGIIIEKHYMSPSELSKKTDVWDNVPEAMKLATKFRDDQNVNKQSTSKKVPIFEIRGEFSQEFWKEANDQKTNDRDKNKYSYQLYIVAGEVGKQVILYMEDDTERVYKYLARKRKSGRALGIGVIEEAEQAQVWTNDAIQKQQRAMEYTSKFVGQSASKKLKGRNMLTEADNGLILEHDDGKPITRVEMSPSQGLQQFEQYITLWYSQLEKSTSSYAAQRGETPPSGTPYRLQAAVLQQSSSVFDDLKEEFGIFIGEIFYDWILPYLSGRLNKEHILAYEFSADELKSLDKSYSLHSANRKVINKILSPNFLFGEAIRVEEYDILQKMALEEVQKSKTHRFMDIPKDYYKNLKPKLTFSTTGEQRNKAATLESLSNILMLVASNPTILQDPVLAQIFARLVELSGAGISPVTLMAGIQEQAKQMQAQQEAQQQGQQTPQAQPQQQESVSQPQTSLAANPV